MLARVIHFSSGSSEFQFDFDSILVVWACRHRECADVHSAETIVSVCRVGLKVMDGGGFAASLNEFSKAWAIYFPDVVCSKSKKALTKM